MNHRARTRDLHECDVPVIKRASRKPNIRPISGIAKNHTRFGPISIHNPPKGVIARAAERCSVLLRVSWTAASGSRRGEGLHSRVRRPFLCLRGQETECRSGDETGSFFAVSVRISGRSNLS